MLVIETFFSEDYGQRGRFPNSPHITRLNSVRTTANESDNSFCNVEEQRDGGGDGQYREETGIAKRARYVRQNVRGCASWYGEHGFYFFARPFPYILTTGRIVSRVRRMSHGE